MDEKGVYAVARSLWESDAFMNQKFTQREAWLWLIGAAVWRQTRLNLDGKRITLERGEFAFAVRFLATKWKWSKSAVGRFIILLEKRDMIRDTSRDSRAVFSICKYNDFQVVGLPKRDEERDTNRDALGTDVGQTRDKEETLQTLEAKKEVKERAPALRVVHSKPLPVWLSVEAWSGYLEMRRKLKKSPTERGIDLLIAKLEKFMLRGHDPTAILDNSTQNNWIGIFEPKAERNGQRSNHETFAQAAYLAAGDD